MKIIESTATTHEYFGTAFSKLMAFHRQFDDWYRDFSETAIKSHLEKQDIAFIATGEDGSPMGAVMGQYFAEPPDLTKPYAKLRNIWVEEAYRGQGVAQALITAFEARAKALGAAGIEINVDVRNPLGTALWNEAGYVAYQERRRKLI